MECVNVLGGQLFPNMERLLPAICLYVSVTTAITAGSTWL
jgi:hypothetical protein